MKLCTQCKKEFEIMDEDKAFYVKIDVPEPRLCPPCRDRRRWASGNDLSLSMRSCDLCKKQTISMYSPTSPYTVYCTQCYWSDAWDAASYGKDFDFSRTFFEQFNELQKQVPRLAASTFNCEESPYINNCGDMKRCYMCTSCGFCEGCFYLIWGELNRECSDGFRVQKSELCYELVNSSENYHSAWLFQCEGMIDSYFCYDSKNCTKCIFSSNLRNKTLHIYNKPVSEEEYSVFVKTLSSAVNVKKYTDEWRAMIQKAIHRNLVQRNCESTLGDFVSNATDSYVVYDCDDIQQMRYSSFIVGGASSCMDITSYGFGCELSYEGYGLGGGAYGCCFTRQCVDGCADLSYSDLCSESHDLFGCVNMRKKSRCIFNKQYSQEEYSQLRGKLIDHMRKTGEYGEYFPGSLSPFGYNESSAMLYYPLVREEAIALGYRWSDELLQIKGKETIAWSDVPDTIEECPRSLSDEIFTCTGCERNYKIIKQECEFLEKMHLPLPRICPQCRHVARIALRNPQTFWHRQCMCEKSDHGHTDRCRTEFETSYTPNRVEIVYCEHCYQKEIV